VTGTEADKGPKKAATGDENFIVTLTKGAGGKMAVRDVQGNVAGVVSGPVKVGKLSVYVIDKVLMSGECAGHLTVLNICQICNVLALIDAVCVRRGTSEW
jgi:hypothetical protein